VNAHLRISGLLRELERNNASLSDARDELERRVAERTQELRLANAKLTQEIGERRQAEDQLNFLARHDYLTRLLNRTAFEEALSVLLSRLSPGGVEHTLLYLDLDQFKLVNDTAGHMAGDELLRQIGDLLRRTLAPQDIVARLGGDDFAALVPAPRDCRLPLHVARADLCGAREHRAGGGDFRGGECRAPAVAGRHRLLRGQGAGPRPGAGL